jgi:hypothetical protein
LAYSTAPHSIQAREFIYAGSPTVMFEENFPSEQAVTDCVIGATTLVTASLAYLYEGDIITSIGFCTGATASITTSHRLVGIYSAITVPAQLATSADNTSATLAANTIFTQALSTPFSVPSSGAFWIAFLETAATMNTMVGRASGLNVTATAAINAQLASTRTNGLCVTATGGSTTLPATLASLTQLSVQPWFFLI